MKKTKKALASLAIAGMALTMVPFNAFATGTVPTRIAGTTAAQTAVAIADQTGWTGTAILASSASYGMVDALTAGPLASFLKAPILLTGAGNTLDADTKAELTKLAVKTVYVTSGTAVISQAVLDQLTGMGITVVPLGGVDRAATSVNIAKKMTGVTKVAVANGLQDALSIAAIASAANEPILLTDKDALPASVSAYLAATGITSSDVIGGTGVISDAVKALLPSATRHAGNSAYDTNNQVIQDFNSSLTYGNVYVANGVTGIDALAGAPLAAQTKSAIVLTDGTVPAAANFVSGKLAAGSVVTALGGAAVVPETVRVGVTTGVVAPGALTVTKVSAINAQTLEVVLGRVASAAEQTATKFAVTKTDENNNTVTIVMAATFSADGTKANLSSGGNLMKGTYKVTASAGVTGTGSVTVKDREVGKISILATKMIKTGAKTATVPYKVFDQYGVDITKNSLATPIIWTNSYGSGGNSNGTLTITTTGADFDTNSTAVITAIDGNTGVTATQNVTWASSANIVSVDFGTAILPSGKTAIQTGNGSAASIPLTIKDEFGNVLNDTTALGNTSTGYLITTTSDSTVGTSLSVDADSNVLMNLDTTGMTDAKTLTINMIVRATGKSFSTTVSVVKPALPNAVAFGSFSSTVAVGDTAVNIPLVVTDQFGATISADDVASDVSMITVTSSNTGVIGALKIATGGSHKGNIVLDTTTYASVLAKGTTVVTVYVNSTGKSASLTISSVDARIPDTVKAASDFKTSMIQGSNNKFAVNVTDQFGTDFLDSSIANTAANDLAYHVVATVTKQSGDDGAVTLTGDAGAGVSQTITASENTSTYPFQLNAAADKVGTYKLALKLTKIADSSVLSEVDKTITVVKNNVSGLVYGITDIPKLAGNTYYAPALGSGEARPIKITAKDASGVSYAVPYSSIFNVTCSDPRVASVAKDPADSNKWYVGSVGLRNAATFGTDFVGEKTATITVYVNTDNGVQTFAKQVTASSSAPMTQLIKLVDTPASDIWTMDATAGTITDINYATRALADAGTEMYAYAMDQYGVYSLLPANTAFLAGDASKLNTAVVGDGFVFDGVSRFKLKETASSTEVNYLANTPLYVSAFKDSGAATLKVTVTSEELPTVVAATTKMLTATTFQVTFSEAVNATAGNFTAYAYDADGAGAGVPVAINVVSIAGSGTSTITVTTAANTGFATHVGTATVKLTGIKDLAGNALTTVTQAVVTD